MAYVNGNNASFTLDDVDLSAFINNTTFDRSADAYEVTAYGDTGHAFVGGLTNGKCTIEGSYDNGTTSPAATIRPLIGTKVTFVYCPEGDDSGKPQVSGNVIVVDYQETVPVADVIKWSADLQISGSVTDGTVSA